MLASIAFAVAAAGTFCQASEVVVSSSLTALEVTGCGEGYPDNLLWHLDRADSRDGTLDGHVTRPATGRGVHIYIADSGVQRDHEEFRRVEGSNVVAGIDAVAAASLEPLGCNGAREVLEPCVTPANLNALYSHGTAVAAIAAGARTGVAPDARIVSVLVLARNGLPLSVWREAFRGIIRHAWDQLTPQFATAVLNISSEVSDGEGHPELPLLMQTMRDMTTGVDAEGNPDPDGKRFVFTVAAGNDPGLGCDESGRTLVDFARLGAEVDGIITVGGLTRDNALWPRSCRGPEIDILAPAEEMLLATTTGFDHYRGSRPENRRSGTSFAAPYVAGIVATMLEMDPSLTPAAIERRLKQTASRVRDASEETAGGRVAVYGSRVTARRRAVGR